MKNLSLPQKWKLTVLTLFISAGGLQAQTFNSVSLYDLLLASGATSFETKTTSFSGLIPGTGITVQATTTEGVFAEMFGGVPAASWLSSNADPTSVQLTNNWTITLAAC